MIINKLMSSSITIYEGSTVVEGNEMCMRRVKMREMSNDMLHTFFDDQVLYQ